MSKPEILDKIKKLLALSSDSGTTEHERNVALNRAKDLMAQHSVEECDLNSPGKVESLIVEEIYIPNLENPLPAYLHDPMLFCTLLNPITNNFGVYNAFHKFKNIHQFMGFKQNVEIAKYACDVLLNQGIKDCRDGYKEHRSIGFTVTFWNGFIAGLHKRFIKLSNETAIVLYDKVKEQFEKNTQLQPIELPTSNERAGFSAGMKSAMDAQLNPAVQTSRGNLLK